MLRTILFLWLLFNSEILFSQVVELNYLKYSTTLVFNHDFYVFGYLNEGITNEMVCEKRDSNLQIISQKKIPLLSGYGSMPFQLDTTHDRINIFIPLEGKKESGKLVLLNKDIEVLLEKDDFPLSNWNTFFAFDLDAYVKGNFAYSIRPISSDSSGQFLLRKYSLKSRKSYNDYLENWQFSFKGNDYNFIKILGTYRDRLLLFADAKEGNRKGQWFIQLNSLNGKVIHALKIPVSSEIKKFYFHNLMIDSIKPGYFLSGFYADQNLVNSNGTLSIDQRKEKVFSFSIIGVDTSSEIIFSKEFKLPIPSDCMNSKKYNGLFLNVTHAFKNDDNIVFRSSILGHCTNDFISQFGVLFFELDLKISSAVQIKSSAFTRTDLADSKDRNYLLKLPYKFNRENKLSAMIYSDELIHPEAYLHYYSNGSESFIRNYFWVEQKNKKIQTLQRLEFLNGKTNTAKVKEFDLDGGERTIFYSGNNFLIIKKKIRSTAGESIQLEKINY